MVLVVDVWMWGGARLSKGQGYMGAGMMDDRALAAAIARVAVLRGRFTLRSGRQSDYYIDKYLFETDPVILGALAERLAGRVGDDVDRLAGAELGGVPLAAATALARGVPYLIVRNSRKEYGTGKGYEGGLGTGDRVMLLEDVVTTGGQILEAARTLEGAGARVVGIVAVLDRLEGGRETIEAAGYDFEALLTVADLGIVSEG